jgi:hypothetical protein
VGTHVGEDGAVVAAVINLMTALNVVILAGDVHTGKNGLRWITQNISPARIADLGVETPS